MYSERKAAKDMWGCKTMIYQFTALRKAGLHNQVLHPMISMVVILLVNIELSRSVLIVEVITFVKCVMYLAIQGQMWLQYKIGWLKELHVVDI